MGGLILIPLAAACVCVLLHLAALRLFPAFNLLDFPERYGLTRQRLPYPTGILASIVFLAFYAWLEPHTLQFAGVLLGVTILAISCVIDDRRPLSPWVRLGVQVSVGLLVFATGTRIYSLTNPLDAIGLGTVIPLDRLVVPVAGLGTLPVISGIFTIFWLGLTINALNWFDGIPGQVSTVSTIGFIIIGLLSLSERVNQPELALLSFVLAGISAACLLFDAPPPRVVMGDSGAMFFGLMLGILTIYAGGKVATAFLVLGVPLIDSMLVAIRRMLKGSSPLRGSNRGEHLHHRLLECGWSAPSVVLLTAAIGTIFGSCALFLSTGGKFGAAGILGLLMILLVRYTSRTKIPGK